MLRHEGDLPNSASRGRLRAVAEQVHQLLGGAERVVQEAAGGQGRRVEAVRRRRQPLGHRHLLLPERAGRRVRSYVSVSVCSLFLSCLPASSLLERNELYI